MHKQERDLQPIESLEPMILMSASIDGTDAADWISGDEQDNIIDAMGGNDEIYAPIGNNRVDGGAGEDTFVIYEGVQADFNLSRTVDNMAFVEGPGLNGTINNNTLVNVERIMFNDGVLLVTDIQTIVDPPVDPPSILQLILQLILPSILPSILRTQPL